jgi:hypothetical protein
MPSFLNVTVLHYSVFYKDCTQPNHLLALSRLPRRIHCDSSVFPYKALKSRPAKKIFDMFCGTVNTRIKNLKALFFHSVFSLFSNTEVLQT